MKEIKDIELLILELKASFELLKQSIEKSFEKAEKDIKEITTNIHD